MIYFSFSIWKIHKNKEKFDWETNENLNEKQRKFWLRKERKFDLEKKKVLIEKKILIDIQKKKWTKNKEKIN